MSTIQIVDDMWDLRKGKNTFRTLKSKVSINVLFKRREHPDYKIFLHSELAQIIPSPVKTIKNKQTIRLSTPVT